MSTIDEAKRKWHDHELALIAVGLCPHQTAYGMPGTEECKKEALAGSLFCGEHISTDGPVYRYLDLSTAHLPPALLANLNSYDGVTAAQTEYGWLLWVPEDPDGHAADYEDVDPDTGEDYGVPPEVLAIQRYARSLACERVLLDADAPVTQALPTFREPTLGDVIKCSECGQQTRSISAGCSNCGHGTPPDVEAHYDTTTDECGVYGLDYWMREGVSGEIVGVLDLVVGQEYTDHDGRWTVESVVRVGTTVHVKMRDADGNLRPDAHTP